MSLSWFERIDPVIVIAAVGGAYGLFLALRYQGLRMLAIAWTAACASLLLLPGGTQTLSRLQQLPGPLDRGRCLEQAVVHLAPWKPGEADRVQECDYTGRGGLTAAPSSGEQTASFQYLRSRYG